MKINEISKLIQEEIKKYDDLVKPHTEGTIISIGDGIAIVYGLLDAMLYELVIFEDESEGLLINLEEESVGIILLSDSNNLREGSAVRSTGKIFSIPVGNEYLGRVVNGLGHPIDGKGNISATQTRFTNIIAPGVMKRKEISTPLETGLLAIDSMIPIGRGQRELIIGDRQTGKTTIALNMITNQLNKNAYCIYVGIGQKKSSIAKLYSYLNDSGCMHYTTIISATASAPSAQQFLSAYVGCALAEYWMHNGKDVLIIYDDLSKHAIAYRTISLLLRRPPGREAYPGDIFYIHSSLLERAARLKDEFGGGSITAIPIIETQDGDIASYIPTNIISITDGQIFLNTDLFNSGQRPAIDCGLSVSRVGSAAQKSFLKKISGPLKGKLAQYFELKAFSQFGTDIDKETQKILDLGAKINILLIQSDKLYSAVEEYLLLILINENILAYIPINFVRLVQEKISSIHLKKDLGKLLADIDDSNNYNEKKYKKIVAILKHIVYKFLSLSIDKNINPKEYGLIQNIIK